MIKKLDIRRDFKWLETSSQQAIDIERFRWFSNDYLGIAKNNENIIYDIRFSSIPNEVEGLWGIQLDKNKGKEPPAFLSTHPDPENRVEAIIAHWETLGGKVGNKFESRYSDFKNSLP